MTIEEKFEQAKNDSKALSQKPSNEILLQLYGLYKQGTVGNVNEDAPSNPFDFVAKAKYNAWQSLQGKSTTEAMQEYVDLVEKLKD